MPFNRETGEIIGNLGSDFVISTAERWGATGLLLVAIEHAVEAFTSSGAVLPITIRPDEILVQEYPRQNKVAFLFQRRIAGKEHFYPYVFDLPPQMITKLAASGLWGHKH